MNRSFVMAANIILMIYARIKSGWLLPATNDVRSVQKKVLFDILGQNRKTAFGLEHNFTSICSIDEYTKNVPVSDHDDYAGYINDISEGKEAVLTAEKVLLFEPTSGSVAASKYIPYTKGLKARFQKAIFAWLYDLYANNKSLLQGKSYWQISPPAQGREDHIGKISVGFEEDLDYFGPIARRLLDYLSVVPPEVSKIDDIEGFKYVTLLFLLKEKHLALISVWNPTFLTLLLGPLKDRAAMLLQDIENGSITMPESIERNIKNVLVKKLGKNKHRARELRNILSSDDPSLERIWPHLRLISCWGDGCSSIYLNDIRGLFPNVTIQPKGLIATEAIVSFPLVGHKGHVLAIGSHFFEFMSGTGIKYAWELRKGQVYSVIVTNGGGLYRYRLNDLIEVAGSVNETPLIRFIGKEDNISDVMGEKLNEAHVSSVLTGIFGETSLLPLFYMLAPEKDHEGRVFYALFLEYGPDQISRVRDMDLSKRLDNELRKNYHYNYCRGLGQLGEAKAFLINASGARPSEIFIESLRLSGKKAGDIKTTVLSNIFGWSSKFEGAFI